MAWDIIDRKAPLEIEVEGVKLKLKPLSWGQRMSFAQRLVKATTEFSKLFKTERIEIDGESREVTTVDMNADIDVDVVLSNISEVLGTVVIEPASFIEDMKSSNDMVQFLQIKTAIFGAYNFDEKQAKN